MSLYRIVEQRERARAREEERERERKRTDPFLFRSERKFIVSSGIISEIPIFHLYQRCCPGKQKKKGMRFLISRILNVLIVHPTFIVHIYIYTFNSNNRSFILARGTNYNSLTTHASRRDRFDGLISPDPPS